MTQTTDGTPKKPLIDVIITVFNQTIILFLGIIVPYIITLNIIHLAVSILSCSLIFILFGISYSKNKPALLKWGFAATAVFYFAMALFTYDFFVSLFSIVIVSSLIIAFQYSKHNGGRSRAITPSIVTIMQILTICSLTISSYGLLPHQLAYRSMFEKYVLLGFSLFLVISIFSNFVVLVWKRWWIMASIVALGMVTASIYIFKGDEYITQKMLLMVVLIYILGMLATYLINYQLTKSNPKNE